MIRFLQYAFLAVIVTTVGFSLYQWNASRASTQKTAPNNGLVGYWSFNEGTGTQAGDASGNNNTGTLTNGPTWTDGKKGQSASFDGTDDYITMGDRSSLEINNNSLAFGGWFYINAYPAVNNRMFLITKGGTVLYYEYELTVSGYSSNHLTVSLFNTALGNYITATSTTVPPLNTWFHVMGVWDKDAVNIKLYYNGVLESTNNSINGAIHTTRDANFEIGRRGDNAEAKLNGKADEVRVYNRALSGTEIANIVSASKLNVSPVSNLTSGLVGYWTFDGKDTPWTSSSAGTATDRSGNSNTGTLTNMSQSTSVIRGQLGQALTFDGSNDYVTVSNAASLNVSTTVTYSAWVKPASLATTNTVFRKTVDSLEDKYMYISTAGIVSCLLYNTTTALTSIQVLSVGNWYLLTETYDGTTQKLYINGVLDNSKSASGDVADSTGAFNIGFDVGNNYYFNGQIDDVRIYNRALSSTEIQSLYDLGASDRVNSSVSQNQGTGRLDSGLAGYWKLDDASGTTATDSSVNGNNGTLTNGPTWNGPAPVGTSVVCFDGTNDYIDLGNRSVLNLTNNFTVSLWARISNLTQSNYKRLFGRAETDTNNRPFYIEYDYTANQYRAVWRNAGTYGSVVGKTLTAVGWQHFVVTFKDGVVKGYSDGVLTGSASGAVQPISTSSNTYIGDIGTGHYFPGCIDEVRVYNRALSADEISQLYRLTTPTGVDTSLKGYWSFDGSATNWTSSSAGTVADLSGSGNTGTLTNMSRSTSPVSGKLGQGLKFDGVDDYVYISRPIVTSLPFSFSAWVRPTSAGVDNCVVTMADEATTDAYYALSVNSSGNFVIQNGDDFGSSFATSTTTATLNMWYHIVGVWTTNTDRKIYVNGVLEATDTSSRPTNNSLLDNTAFGILKRSSVAYYPGQIDEVRIYNRALSTTEITALYNSGR